MKHEKNQGCNIIAENSTKNKSTVERLTAEQLRQLTVEQRIEYAKKLNGSQPKTTSKHLVLDKSTLAKIDTENKSKAVNQATPKADKKNGKKARAGKKTGKSEKAVTTNPFLTAITDFEQMYIDNRYIIPTADTTLYNLSKAVAFSVIKKLIQVSADKMMLLFRAEAVKNFALLDNLNKRDLTDTSATYDSNGNIKLNVLDKEYNKAVDKVLQDSISQGVDIVHQASIIILNELSTVQQKNGQKPLKLGFMLEPYESRKTNGKTFVVNGKKSVEWKNVEVIPISNIFKNVRAYIQNNKSIKALVNGYSYIESLSFDSESDEVEKIYYRLDKYADLGETVTDFNGKETAYTTTAEQVKTYQKSLADLITKASLDQKHIDFIRCRVNGKSLVDTAAYLGVSLRTVERIQKDLQTKSIAVGYGTVEMLPKAENKSESKNIIAIDEKGNKFKFDSIKQASIALDINRKGIQRVLQGKLTATKGYTFKYAE